MRTQEITCVKGPAQLMALMQDEQCLRPPPLHQGCLGSPGPRLTSHTRGPGIQEANPPSRTGLNTEARGNPDTPHVHVEMSLAEKENKKRQEAAIWWPQPGLWALFL